MLLLRKADRIELIGILKVGLFKKRHIKKQEFGGIREVNGKGYREN